MAQAQLSSSCDQRPRYTNIPTKITMENNDLLNNITNTNGDITIIRPGNYFIMASPQVNKNHGKHVVYIDFWIVVNGIAVPNSNIRLSLINKQETDVIVSQGVVALNQGDIVNVYMNVIGDGCKNHSQTGIVATIPQNTVEPVIPSIIFSMFSLN